MRFNDGELGDAMFMERASGNDTGNTTTKNQDTGFAGRPLVGERRGDGAGEHQRRKEEESMSEEAGGRKLGHGWRQCRWAS